MPPKLLSVQRNRSVVLAPSSSAAPCSAISRSCTSVKPFTTSLISLSSARYVSARRWWCQAHLSQVGLLGPQRPGREPFAVLPLLDEVAYHPVDVVAELVAGDLVLAQFSAEPAVYAQAAAEVDLEALDRPAITVVDHLALESDVGDLDAGARVRAPVDVERDRHVEHGVDVSQALLQVGHQRLCPDSCFGERQLAELDTGAGHQVLAPR